MFGELIGLWCAQCWEDQGRPARPLLVELGPGDGTLMRDALRAEGVELDAVYHCPFHPEHGVGDYKREHEDRKPGTGMLRKGAVEFGISLTESVMIGDRCSDVAAANAAGLRQAFLIAGTETAACPGEYLAVQSLAEVERWLTTVG